MAKADSTGAHHGVDVRALGFVCEVFAIARNAGATASIDLGEDGSFCFAVAGTDEALLAAETRGLPFHWDAPLRVEWLLGGCIEKQTLPDNWRETARIAFWGRPEDLVSNGIAPSSRVERPRTKWRKGYSGRRGDWHSYFAPSGHVLYYTSAEGYPLTVERNRRRDAVLEAIDRGEDLGVIRQDEPSCTTWIGTKEDLIGAHVCAASQFPAGRLRYLDGNDHKTPNVERWATVAMRCGYFEHRVWWDSATTAERQREERCAAREGAPPRDPEEFAEACERWLHATTSVLIDMISGDGRPGATRYNATTVEKVTDALEHAAQLLQSSMPAIPRAKLDSRVAAAAADASFSQFMAAALEAPKKGPPRTR